MGKGNEKRLAHLGAGGGAAINAWLLPRQVTHPVPLICHVTRRDEIQLAMCVARRSVLRSNAARIRASYDR